MVICLGIATNAQSLCLIVTPATRLAMTKQDFARNRAEIVGKTSDCQLNPQSRLIAALWVVELNKRFKTMTDTANFEPRFDSTTYYTTGEVMAAFGWQARNSIKNNIRRSGFPAETMAGRPNKWLGSALNSFELRRFNETVQHHAA